MSVPASGASGAARGTLHAMVDDVEDPDLSATLPIQLFTAGPITFKAWRDVVSRTPAQPRRSRAWLEEYKVNRYEDQEANHTLIFSFFISVQQSTIFLNISEVA